MIELKIQKALENNSYKKEIVFCMIAEELKGIGFKTDCIGFIYLQEAIYMYLTTPLHSDIISEIYGRLAKRFGRIPLSINRSITKAISDVWNGKINKLNYTLLTTSISAVYMPQNAEFIATIAENVIIRLRKELNL